VLVYRQAAVIEEGAMQFAVNTPNFGAYSDARMMAGLAREAEEAGWDGFYIWDHMFWTWPENQPVADPYVLLTAMAMSTERLRLGALVTPIARRRPHKLAREIVTLDHLTGGRITLGVGIGGDWFGDYSTFGEPTDDKTHAEMLDEGLDVLCGLWRGEKFSYEGTHYKIKDAHFIPTPVQGPRVPIWVAGMWPNKRPFRRAAQWDGVCPLRKDDEPMTPDDFRAVLAYIGEHRTSNEPFDVIFGSKTLGESPQDAEKVGPYAEAGVTWWLENFTWDDTLEQVHERVRKGPPKI
jgi:alkanesulfonate monooxygenase SsuD/methylene tetrahydromethanopterin reductase-like flavin-dependent oxidoreductase (luciferase family)